MNARCAVVGVALLVTAAPAAAGEPTDKRSPCNTDDQCPRRTICDADLGRCVPLRRHINLLYMFYRSADRRFTEVGGIYWNRDAERGYRVVFPLYWSFWSPDSRRRVFAPFYFDHVTEHGRHLVIPPLELHRTPDEQTLRIWPLVFHARRGPQDYSTTVLPLAHFSRVGPRRTVVLPPLLSYVRTDADHSRGMVAGLFHWKSATDQLSLGLLPLFWHRRTPGSRFTWVAPLNFHYTDGRSWALLTPPLLMHLSTPDSSTSLGVAPLPFYHHRSPGKRRLYLPPLSFYHRTGPRWLLTLGPTWIRRSPDGAGFGLPPLFADWNTRRRWLVLFPAAAYTQNRETGRTQLLLTAPLYYHLRDKWRSIDVAPPFFARWRDHERDVTSWVSLGGALVYHRTPETSAQVLFPLWWRFADHRRGTHTTVLGPGFYRRAEDGWQAGLAPLLFAGHRGDRRHLGLLPAFWHHSAPQRSTTWVAPFNVYRRVGERRQLVLAPLLFAGWAPDRQHLVLPPLFWRFRSPGRSTWFVGPGYYHRDGDDVDAGLAPLAFYRRRADRRSLTVVPLFHHEVAAGGMRRRFISPLYVDWNDLKKKRRTRLFGGALLLHQSPESRIRALLPLAWDVRDRLSGRRTVALLPVAYHRSEADGRSLSLLGPAFLQRRADDAGWDAGLVPLFFAGRSGERSHQVVVPLFWRFTGPGDSFTLAGPVLWRRRGADRLGGVLPLVLAGRWNGTRFATIPPLLFHHQRKAATGARFTMVGPYTGWRTASGSTAHSVWPLVHYRRRGAAGNRSTSLSVLPLFSYREDPQSKRLLTPVGGFDHDADGTTAMVGPVYVQRRQETTTVAALPLGFANWKRGAFSEQHRAGLLPLFYTERRPGLHALYTPLGGFRTRAEPRSRLWYAGTFFATRSPERSVTALLPLLVHSRDHLRGRTSLYAFPSYFGRWSAQGSSHLLAPLFWRHRDPETTITAVTPALWDVHHRGISRTTLVFPLYLRRHNERSQTTTHLAPLAWLRLRPRGTDAVLFPVFWHFGGEQRSSTVAFPLLWRFRRPDRRATVVFPFYWDFHRGEQRTLVVLNTLYRRNRSKHTYDFHFLPLVRVQRKRPQDLKLSLLAGLFGYERAGRNRMLKLLLVPIDISR